MLQFLIIVFSVAFLRTVSSVAIPVFHYISVNVSETGFRIQIYLLMMIMRFQAFAIMNVFLCQDT